MMTGRSQIEGYNNLIQSPEVSSSSDVQNSRYIELRPQIGYFPRPRRTYRAIAVRQNSFRYPLLPANLNNDMAIQVHVPSRNLPENNPSFPSKCLSNISTRAALVSVAVIFFSSIFALSLVYRTFPKLRPDEKQHIKIPWNIEDAKTLGLVLNRYKKDHYYSVLSGVFLSYVFLQTFAIPGSLFLSILSGFLFNFYTALILVCTCSALGASLCFLLSQLLGRRLVWLYFPEKAKEWAMIVNKHKENLLNYMIFLRVTPFLPNWFINLTAPVIGVPLVPFALGTFVGVAPPSFVAIQAGQTLHDMSANDSAFSWTSIFWLSVFAVVSLVPIFLKRQLKEKFQ